MTSSEFEVGAATVYEPDALVRCGAPLDDNTIKVADPVIVVEVLSPSSAARDTGVKVADYARVPSLRHYLIVDPGSRCIFHHRVEGEAVIRTTTARSGSVNLDTLGITLLVEAVLHQDLPRRDRPGRRNKCDHDKKARR